MNKNIILTTTDINKKYEIIGLVSGNAVQSKNIVKDLGAGLKSLVGGKLGSYAKLLNETRNIAIDHLVEEAKELNADAVICIRQNTSSIVQGASEISFIGTAIKIIK